MFVVNLFSDGLALQGRHRRKDHPSAHVSLRRQSAQCALLRMPHSERTEVSFPRRSVERLNRAWPEIIDPRRR